MTAVNVTASRATPSIGSSVSSAIAAQGRSGRPPVTRFGPAHSCAMRLASGFHGRSERTGCPRVSEPGERRREPTSRARRVRRTPSRLPLAVRVLITPRDGTTGQRSEPKKNIGAADAHRAFEVSLRCPGTLRGAVGAATTGSASGSSARVDTGGTEKGRPCIPVARPLASRARPSERGSRPRAPSLPTLSSR